MKSVHLPFRQVNQNNKRKPLKDFKNLHMI